MNKKMKTAIMLLVIILIAALAISLSYSRYFTKVQGTGNATVAKWKFDATMNEQAVNAGTITLGNKTADNDKVADGKIAPGTQGTVAVELDAGGTEVALDYVIKFDDIRNKPTNLKFYSDENHMTEVDMVATGITGAFEATNTTKKETKTIYWAWAYGEDSEPDTVDGTNAATVTFNVIVTGTQKGNA